MSEWTKSKLIEYSAGFFQSYDLPDNWENLAEWDLWLVLEENAWEPFENEEGHQIWERIVTSARMFNRDFNLNIKGI